MSTQFLNFAEAMNHLRWGEKLARRNWQPGSHIQIDYEAQPPCLVLRVAHIDMVRTRCELPSHHLLAEDWYVV